MRVGGGWTRVRAVDLASRGSLDTLAGGADVNGFRLLGREGKRNQD